MKIILNGQQQETDCRNLLELIEATVKSPQGVICEYNGEITPQERWAQITLNGEDKIELLSLVGGG